jgi:hypothetical protein
MQADYPLEREEKFAAERRRLTAALIGSALLHASLLTLVKPAAQDFSGTGHPVLSIRFRAAFVAAAPQAAVPPPPVPVLKARPRPPIESPPDTTAPAEKHVAAETAPAPGRNATRKPSAGGVSVRMGIGEGGRIEHILWTELPALTPDQGQRREAMLRPHTAAETLAGSYVTEIVDVRSLLGLPRVGAKAAVSAPSDSPY